MPRHRTGLLSVVCTALVLAFGTLGSIRAHGQAIPAASRTVGASAFAGYTYVHPDFGPAIANNNGFIAGVDLTRFIERNKFQAAVSIEGRININHGATVDEKTYLFGVKVEKAYKKRYHPYADFLVGPGTIDFHVFPQYFFEPSDNSIVYSYGPGVDVDVYRNFALKVDYQFTHWDLSRDFTLTPGVLDIGVKYNLPFRSRYRARDLR
jgi:opacity protein-like surface antigen